MKPQEFEALLKAKTPVVESAPDPIAESAPVPVLKPMNLDQLDRQYKALLGESSLREFAPGEGGSDFIEYIKALARAWYTHDIRMLKDVIKKGGSPMSKIIDAQTAVEKMMARGIHCPDGKVRKYYIDYDSEFLGVDIASHDFYEYTEYGEGALRNTEVDGRTGKPWGPYEHFEFKGRKLGEGIEEAMMAGGSEAYAMEDEQLDGMALGELKAIAQAAKKIYTSVKRGVPLEAWMYKKITNGNEGLTAVAQQINNPAVREQQGVAEGYQLDEGIMDSLSGIINKIKMTPGIQKFIGAAKAKQDQLIQALQHSANGKDLVANIQQAVGGQQAVAEGWGQKISGAVAASAGGGLLAGAADIMMRAYIAMGKPDIATMWADKAWDASQLAPGTAGGQNVMLLVGWLVVLGALAMLAGGTQVKKGMDADAKQSQAQRGQQGVAEARRDAYQRDYDRSISGMDAGPLGYGKEWDEEPPPASYKVYVSDGTTWHRSGGIFDSRMQAQIYIHREIFTKDPAARAGVLGPGDARPQVEQPSKKSATEGKLNEIKKGQKDANGYTRCWPGKHAEGTKKGKNGGRVRNCVPNESMSEATGDPKFDKMLKDITSKKAVAKQQKADTKQQARDAIDSMFGGGNPADKLSIRKKGVAEGSREMTGTNRDRFISRMSPSIDHDTLMRQLGKVVNSPEFNSDTILKIVDAGDKIQHPVGRYIQKEFDELQYDLGRKYEDYPEEVAEKLLDILINQSKQGVAEGDVEHTPTGLIHRVSVKEPHEKYARDIDHLDKHLTSRLDKSMGISHAHGNRKDPNDPNWSKKYSKDVGESTDYAAQVNSLLNEFAGGMGAGSVASAPGRMQNPAKVGSLFGGSYSPKNSPFKKKPAKKKV